MTYRTILAEIDHPRRAEALMPLANEIASRQEAHLIGLHVVPKIEILAAAAAEIPAAVLNTQQKYFEDMAEESRAAFQRHADDENINTEWRQIDAGGSDISALTARHARGADLVLMGQVDPDHDLDGRRDTVERVLMDSGRPVLMLPYAGTYRTLGRHAIIAWSPSRESARAVFDALPLLSGMEKVTVLCVDPDQYRYAGTLEPGDAIALALTRHGIKAEAAHTVSGDLEVAERVLSYLTDEGCDFLVMGGYGHSRLREFVFGGMTRRILDEMTVPALLSH